MDNKKTKLTISGNPKKTFKDFNPQKSQGKKTVVIDKQSSKAFGKVTNNRSSGSKQSFSFKKGTQSKNNFFSKAQPIASDFEKRKLAEQRATKRLKGESPQKGKSGSKRRELKLTISRALKYSDFVEKT